VGRYSSATWTELQRAMLDRKCIALDLGVAGDRCGSARSEKQACQPLMPVHEALQPKTTESDEAHHVGLNGRHCAADATIAAGSA